MSSSFLTFGGLPFLTVGWLFFPDPPSLWFLPGLVSRLVTFPSIVVVFGFFSGSGGLVPLIDVVLGSIGCIGIGFGGICIGDIGIGFGVIGIYYIGIGFGGNGI